MLKGMIESTIAELEKASGGLIKILQGEAGMQPRPTVTQDLASVSSKPRKRLHEIAG